MKTTVILFLAALVLVSSLELSEKEKKLNDIHYVPVRHSAPKHAHNHDHIECATQELFEVKQQLAQKLGLPHAKNPACYFSDCDYPGIAGEFRFYKNIFD